MGRVTDTAKRKDDMHDLVLTDVVPISEHAIEFAAQLLPEASRQPLIYRPGQWAYLIDSQGFRADQRAFSFASAPHDDHLAFGIEIVPGGLFTPRVKSWKVGDIFSLRGPYGTFQLREPLERDLVLIGFNAGIVPFRSFLRHLRQAPAPIPRQIALLACHTSPDYAFWASEFRESSQREAGLRYVEVLTGSTEGASLPVDQLIPLLADAAIADAQCYVAGVGAFVDAIRVLLEAQGVPRSQLVTERYD